ncbi:malectin domain-containing carbohydrate-binding protein [Geodermatophilus sp. SYSU D00965]
MLGLSAVAVTTGVSGASGVLETAASVHCPEGTANQVAVARVNISGPQVTVGGRVWSADLGTQARTVAVAEDRDIRGTRADVLYRTSRVGEFRYELPVGEAGEYVVRMHAAEPWFGVDGRPGGRGSRVFSVSIEDGEVGSPRVDVARAAGGPLRAWTKAWTARVDDGNVTIEARGIRDLPLVTAIEVHRKHPRGTCVPVTSTRSPRSGSAPGAPAAPSAEAPAAAPSVDAAPPQVPDDAGTAPAAPTASTPAAPAAPAPPAAAAGTDAALGLLTAATGRPFATTSVWNTPIPANPAIDRNSAAMVRSVTASNTATANLYAYGEPVFTAVAGTPTARVTCTEDWGTCDVAERTMRIPADAQPTSGSDGRMIIVDLVDRVVCDFWQARRTGAGQWTTSWGTCADLAGTGSGPNGGATGAGINALTGVVRTFEMRNLHIPHTLSVATNNSCSGQFRAPAVKTDGESGRADCVPEGARLQLDPSIDVDAIPNMTPGERAVARALQTYGAINRDNCGSNLCVQFEAPFGEADPYPAAGFSGDYYTMPHIPWNRLRVLAG